MKIHPIVGAEILEQVRFPYPVAPIVRSHHERWDGSGYPDGRCGEQIPIGARILSAVDCLDALASDRQYRRALPLDEAIKVVQQEAGKSFDPRVVAVLARRYVELERMAKSSGSGEKLKLSTDLKVERGAAPAAGFETAHGEEETTRDLASIHRAIVETERRSRGLAELTAVLERAEGRQSALSLLQAGLPAIIPYEVMVLYRSDGDRLKPEFLDGDSYRQFAELEIPLGGGLSGWVAENSKSILNGNPSVEPGYLADPTRFSSLRSALSVPIQIHGGVCGVLSLYRKDRDAFTRDDLSLLVTLSTSLAQVLSATRQKEQAA